MNQKKAFFRFEASECIGAGHAIRSCVIADALTKKGWLCHLITSLETYQFIPSLDRFNRIEPLVFERESFSGELMVIDHYGLDHVYEAQCRPFIKKIMVIDDLANRKHECDILLDQTYGRSRQDYKHLVPAQCTILTGSEYVLLREEFLQLRAQALEKRRETVEVKTILITMGGSDPQNFTLKALQKIKESNFQGKVDVVLGFKSQNRSSVEAFCVKANFDYHLHLNANMPDLIFKADLAIGAAGSGVWERCCLGLPQVLMVTAENQNYIYQNILKDMDEIYSIDHLSLALTHYQNLSSQHPVFYVRSYFLEKLENYVV